MKGLLVARDAGTAFVLSFCTGPIFDFVFGLIPGQFAAVAAEFISPLNPMWWFMVGVSVLGSVGYRLWQLSKKEQRQESLRGK